MKDTKEAVKEIRSFNRFYTNLIGVVDKHILNSRYSLTEVRIMFEVDSETGITARQLKNILLVDEGYLSRTIDKLIKEGILKRTRSEKDKRVYFLSLTSKGKKEFSELNKKSEKEIEILINQLSHDEISEIVKITRRIKQLFIKGK